MLIAALVLASASPLAPLVKRLETAGYMTGSFVQEETWALTLETEQSAGTMHLAQPNLFRLEYSDPEGASTGYDGDVLYSADPLAGQVLVYPDRSPTSFLHMVEEARDSGTVLSEEVSGDSVTVSLSGSFGEGICRMTVGYTMADSLPWLFGTTDVNGNTVLYRMYGVQTADEPPEGVFSMEVPEGWETVQAGGR